MWQSLLKPSHNRVSTFSKSFSQLPAVSAAGINIKTMIKTIIPRKCRQCFYYGGAKRSDWCYWLGKKVYADRDECDDGFKPKKIEFNI